MPTKIEAAATIVRYIQWYRFKKNCETESVLLGNPVRRLLEVFELRFVAMRAVAAAKFITNQPIEDLEQEQKIKNMIAKLAIEKSMVDLTPVVDLFDHAMTLSKSIQYSYLRVWDKRWNPAREWGSLIARCYEQLWDIIDEYDVSISTLKVCQPTASDVLILAREIIKYANVQIIEFLSRDDNLLLDVSYEELCDAFEKLLANYMSPRVLQENEGEIAVLSDDLKIIAYSQTMRL